MTHAERFIDSNRVVALDSSFPAAVVQSGSAAVFAVERDSGDRLHLFSVAAGDAVMAAPCVEGARWIVTLVSFEPMVLRASSEVYSEDWLARLRGVAEKLCDGGPADLFEALDAYSRKRDETDRKRFETRIELNGVAVRQALGDLVESVGTAQRSQLPVTGDALFDAAHAVAAALGCELQPAPDLPYRSEQDRLQAMVDVSGVRTRVVALTGEWWKTENGPLLGFRACGAPVALLPVQHGWFGAAGYVLFDPDQRIRTQVNRGTASELEAFGRMFYRPLTGDLSSSNLIRFALRGSKRDVATLIATAGGLALLGLVAPAGAAILVSDAIPDADSAMIWQVALAMGAAGFGSAIFLLTQSVAMLRIRMSAFAQMQSAIWDHLLKLGPSFFRRFTAGQLRVMADAVTSIHRLLTADALRSLFSGATSMLMLLIVLWYSPALCLIGICCAALSALATVVGARAVYGIQAVVQSHDEALSGLVLQAIAAVTKLRTAGATERAFAWWAREYSDRQGAAIRVQRIRDQVQVAVNTMPAIAIALTFFYVQRNPMPVGTFVASNAALAVFMTSVAAACLSCLGLAVSANHWSRTRVILAAEPEVDSSRAHPGRLRGAISVENLRFRYRSDGPMILDDVSIHAEPGECIALTGPSGSGKSTLLHLILQFEKPASGAIYLDGRDLASLDISAVRRQIGVVMQDGRLMSASIFDNICAGARYSMDEVWEAARAAGMAGDLDAMPMGLHTVVSEGGGNLSGGQRQRLLIARALAGKPSIVFFDEGTSALDNRTQAIVTESLRRMGTTRVLIAHRLSTIRTADRIYVLEKGRVVQQGRYEELVTQNGLFARLASRQSV